MALQLSGCGSLGTEYIEPTLYVSTQKFFWKLSKFHEKPLLTASLMGTFSSKFPREEASAHRLFTDVSIPDFFRGGGVCTQAYFTLCPRKHNRSDAKPTCFPDRLVILNEDDLELDFQTIRKRDFAEILEIFWLPGISFLGFKF